MDIFKRSLFILIPLLVVSCMPTKPAIDIAEQLPLAEAGDPIAQLKLGIAYDSGIGTKRDMEKAVIWYTKSAEQGNSDAQNSLGSTYQAGDGVSQDSKAAVKWYTKAAEQNHATAQNSLAIRYLLGEGAKQDSAKAVYWYEESAKNGNIHAIRNLGNIYTAGRGVEKNLVEAYKWLELARFYTLFEKNMNLKWGVRGEQDDLILKMTSSQIVEGKKLATEWDNKYGHGKN